MWEEGGLMGGGGGGWEGVLWICGIGAYLLHEHKNKQAKTPF
jgi:hypothetical protein